MSRTETDATQTKPKYHYDRSQYTSKEEVDTFVESLRRIPGSGFRVVKNGDEISKEENLLNLCARVTDGQYDDEMTFVNSIMKSYVGPEGLPVEIANSHIKHADLTIRGKYTLVTNFLNDHMLSGKTVSIKDKGDLWTVVSGIVAEETERIFGDVVYLDLKKTSMKNSNLALALVKAFKINGYEKVEGLNLYVKENANENSNASHYQRFLKNAFVTVVRKYVENISDIVNENMSLEEFEKTCAVIEKFLSNCERKMTSKTREDREVVDCKEILKEYFNFAKRTAFDTLSHGDLYLQVKAALKARGTDKETEETKKVLENFFERVQVLKKALSVKDKAGNNYPANYFAVMPVRLASICELLANYRTSFRSTSVRNEIDEVEALIRETFPNHNHFGVDFKKEPFLRSQYQMRIQRKDGEVIDLLDKTVFDKFCAKVDSTFKKYNLPMTEVCFKSVCDKLARGEEPINLKGTGAEKFVSNKGKGE